MIFIIFEKWRKNGHFAQCKCLDDRVGLLGVSADVIRFTIDDPDLLPDVVGSVRNDG